MGRSINFYIVPKNIPHDTTKQLCFSWEFQDDECEIEIDICWKLMPNVILDKAAKHKLLYENLYGYDIDVCHWCPKCFMFANGLYSSPVLLASECISHSYSNGIWNSKWNIKDLWLGSSSSSFVNLFRNDYLYREICSDDIRIAFETIEDLGEPLRISDKEACEETLRVLNFLREWTSNENVYVILEDEA
jgi:hypothetical protein